MIHCHRISGISFRLCTLN